MIHIPVEGGCTGGGLTVRHKKGDTSLPFQSNGQDFFFSVSFIDCQHKIAPITEGWSVVLSYYLTWENPLVVAPHKMNLPTFISSLKTVKQILSPFVSPDEDCDTEMLVIPLVNDYAKTKLRYGKLRGTDKLMANLLQSTNELEIHLVTLVLYRAGIAHDERRMNLDREEDDGYPRSPRHLELEDDFTGTKNQRFMAELIEQSCSINDFLLLDGKPGKSDHEEHPIVCQRDFISREFEDFEEIFNTAAPPDREEYNRYDKDWLGDESDCDLQ